MKAKLSQIEDFLQLKDVIIAGVSRSVQKYSHLVYKEFAACGYNTIPINPNIEKIEEVAALSELPENNLTKYSLLILTKNNFEALIESAIQKKYTHIWVNCAKLSKERVLDAYAKCRLNDVNFIANECPFMFLPTSKGIHNFHKSIRKVFRTLPV